MRLPVLFLLLVLLLPVASMGQDIDGAIVGYVNSQIGYYTVCGFPDGTGTSLDDCYYGGVSGQDGTVWVQVRKNGSGVPGIAKERVRMAIKQWNAGGSRSCDGFVYGDADSDASGKIYFTLPSLKLYGQANDPTGPEGYFEYSPTPGLTSWVRFNNGIKVHFKSPDLNHDGKINLSDVPLFATLYGNGTYDAITDFNGDGVENGSDNVIFAQGVYAGDCQ